jgi:hypothetical protein
MLYPLSNRAKKCADGYLDCCPAHNDRNPSLSVTETPDGKLLLHCFAGCSFEEIIQAAGLTRNIFNRSQDAPGAVAKAPVIRDFNKRIYRAKEIWNETITLDRSIAQSYLNSRAIEHWSEDIRFHPNLFNSQTQSQTPAMVCAIRRENRLVGIHRTFLDANGNKLSKMMLGDCKGGAVHLGGTGSSIVVSEGIENGLSVIQMSTQTEGTFIAAMSANNIANLRLPHNPATLVIAADGDLTGQAAALKLGERAAGLGWRASILTPPPPGDWNDHLRCGD